MLTSAAKCKTYLRITLQVFCHESKTNINEIVKVITIHLVHQLSLCCYDMSQKIQAVNLQVLQGK